MGGRFNIKSLLNSWFNIILLLKSVSLSQQLKGEESLKCSCVCRPREETLNKVINDHERT